MFGLLRRKRFERTGFELYGRAVAAARAPAFYARLGVPDTIAGRFDLIGLEVALLIRRLRRESGPEAKQGPELAQAVFDAMFADMDLNLREMGVGDMSVGKRVKALWEAFHGRAAAYAAPLDAADAEALAEALARNIWEGALPGSDPAPRALARFALIQAEALAAQPFSTFLGGQAAFPLPPEGGQFPLPPEGGEATLPLPPETDDDA